MLIVVLLACTGLASADARQTPQQPPWKPKNLRYFPQDITRDALVQRMREFSFALNVRCQYCHSGGDGVSLEGVDFASDDKRAKGKARAMLKMTEAINTSLLPDIPSRAEPRVEVSCVTCHHGLALPKSLQTTLFEIVQKDGAPAAVARYKELRADTTMGRYNFGQWETMELARRLVEAKNTSAAIAILEMTGEYYPKSPDVDLQLGELHLMQGERDQALACFRRTLEKAPDNPRAKARIAELEKK
jgi:Tetratricopeptide repeat/Photosynthetic reaction centre cytochrome C subunit